MPLPKEHRIEELEKLYAKRRKLVVEQRDSDRQRVREFDAFADKCRKQGARTFSYQSYPGSVYTDKIVQGWFRKKKKEVVHKALTKESGAIYNKHNKQRSDENDKINDLQREISDSEKLIDAQNLHRFHQDPPTQPVRYKGM